jgi:hypothetical protein
MIPNCYPHPKEVDAKTRELLTAITNIGRESFSPRECQERLQGGHNIDCTVTEFEQLINREPTSVFFEEVDSDEELYQFSDEGLAVLFTWYDEIEQIELDILHVLHEEEPVMRDEIVDHIRNPYPEQTIQECLHSGAPYWDYTDGFVTVIKGMNAFDVLDDLDELVERREM